MLTRTRKAFTLLELIVVVVVLGILALIAVPSFSSVIDQSATEAADQTAAAIVRAANTSGAFAGTTTNTDVRTALTEAGLTSSYGTFDADALADGCTIISISRGGGTGYSKITISGGEAVKTAATTAAQTC